MKRIFSKAKTLIASLVTVHFIFPEKKDVSNDNTEDDKVDNKEEELINSEKEEEISNSEKEEEVESSNVNSEEDKGEKAEMEDLNNGNKEDSNMGVEKQEDEYNGERKTFKRKRDKLSSNGSFTKLELELLLEKNEALLALMDLFPKHVRCTGNLDFIPADKEITAKDIVFIQKNYIFNSNFYPFLKNMKADENHPQMIELRNYLHGITDSKDKFDTLFDRILSARLEVIQDPVGSLKFFEVKNSSISNTKKQEKTLMTMKETYTLLCNQLIHQKLINQELNRKLKQLQTKALHN